MPKQEPLDRVREAVADNPVSLQQAFQPGASFRDPAESVSRGIDDAATDPSSKVHFGS